MSRRGLFLSALPAESRSAGNDADEFARIVGSAGLSNADSLSRALTDLEQKEESRLRRRLRRRSVRARDREAPLERPAARTIRANSSASFPALLDNSGEGADRGRQEMSFGGNRFFSVIYRYAAGAGAVKN